MTRSLSLTLAALSCAALAACSPANNDHDHANGDHAHDDAGEQRAAPAAVAPAWTLDQLVVGDHRSPENIARNAQRNPKETLEFFGLRPDSVVVEIWPSGGWYTEIIAPYVRDQGKYYAAHWDPDSQVEFIQRGIQNFRDKLAIRPDLYDRVEMTALAPPEKTEIAPPGSADLVLTFRNIHNWMPAGTADVMFEAMYKALKPGGVLGVVEHRGNPEVPQDPRARSGYVNEDYAIELARKAGFVLDARSEINANPADTKDYEGGVWTLPPTLRRGEEDREKYLAIGESDRFTLRFRKPAE
jgi:predicted methyltransferase